jgi:predicted transposase/invertase (TIGR01784 family)
MSPSILDPSLDVVFKLLLTSGPDSHEVLIALLTAVLRPRKPFAKVTVRNPEIARELLDDRGVVLDIFAELEDGTRLDIEMQSERRPSFRRRALYYWARMFGSELERGDDYGQLRPAISVLFLGYRELAGARVHSTFRLLEVHDHERFTDEIELHVIELPKLALATSEEQRDEAKMLAWAKFFAAKSDEEMTEAAMSDSAVEKAHKVLQRVSSDPAARRLAEQRALALVTLKIDFDEIKREGEAIGRAEGEALGIAKGEALGIAKGEALGIAKGEALGIAKGEAIAHATARAAVLDLCEVLGIELTNEHREQLATLSLAELEALRLAIKRDRRWP